jgi:hypothetical protein
LRKLFLLPLLALAFVLQSTPQKIQPLQVKACATDPSTFLAVGGACQFDNSTTPGSLIAIVSGFGSGGTAYPTFCGFVTDSQKNSFACANSIAYWNGMPIWYALNSAGGTRDIIYFAPGIGQMPIIVEYPSGAIFQGFNSGNYATQAIDECKLGGDCPYGWTEPIDADEPCELLLTWGSMGGNGLNLTPGPDFAMRATSNGMFFLEDRTTTTPGLYIGSAKWQYGNHWLMQSAMFKMRNCQ